jgi:hypothetical protein
MAAGLGGVLWPLAPPGHLALQARLLLSLSLCPQTNYLASLGLSFSICEVGMNEFSKLNENL